MGLFENKNWKIRNNKYVVIIVTVLLNCTFTIINRYPILYSDTSTYISSGFELETPFDRPITYGILLRLFSLNGLSLLFVPVAQSLIFIYVLYKVLKQYIDTDQLYFKLLLASLVLSALTGFNWSINQLLPDLFTSLGFLCLLCIFLEKENAKGSFMLYFLFFISAASHISNLIVYAGLLVLLLLFKKRLLGHLSAGSFKVKAIVLASALLISFLIMMSAISKSRHVFYVGNLAQKGILQKILRDKCNESDFKLCLYKDSIPESFDFFVWNPNSPLYKIGGWKESKPEFKKITAMSLTEGKFLLLQLRLTTLFFSKQLVMFDVGEGNGAFKENATLIQRIKKYTLLDKELCLASRQNEGAFLNLQALNLFYTITMGLSFVLLLFLIVIKYKQLGPDLKLILIATAFLIIMSAFLVAFSSEISNRHGSKLLWLITLLNFILLSRPKAKPKAHKQFEQ